MSKDIKKRITDLTNLQFDNKRYSQGTCGCYLKSTKIINNVKHYYKMSNYDSYRLVFGYESINELIVSRLLDCLNIEHLKYKLLNTKVNVGSKIFDTYLTETIEFKKKNERKIALDKYYELNAKKDESQLDFIKRIGFTQYLDDMLFVDYLILNRDRHGANIEVLLDDKSDIRLSPLFDHGMSLLLNDYENKEYVSNYDIYNDVPANNYIGTRSVKENMKLITNKEKYSDIKLSSENYKYIFEGLDDIIPKYTINKLMKFIKERLRICKDLL